MDKHFDHKTSQARWNTEWEESGVFAPKGDGSDPFVIILPPPNVTGVLHVGHVLGDTVQDMLIRWKRMRGFDTLWLPGTDHAGIATQTKVERQIRDDEGKSRRDLGRDEFLKRVWEWKEKHGGIIINQLKKQFGP